MNDPHVFRGLCSNDDDDDDDDDDAYICTYVGLSGL